MSLRTGNPSQEMKKHGSRMFVGRNRFAESDIPEILKGIRERIVGVVTRLPEAVSFREFFGRECGEAQKVVRPVFDHVDPEVVAGVDTKVRSVLVAKCESLKFDDAVKRRVLDARYFGNIHQAHE